MVCRFSFLFVLLLAAFIISAGRSRAADDALIAHWPLAGDASNHAGNGHHASNHGADFSATGPDDKPRSAARFNGRDSFLRIAPSPELQLGTDDFTFAVWVHVDDQTEDATGDILSWFDPRSRRGLNLTVTTHAGATSNQANYNNLHFGIDQGRLDAEWTDRGRPGNAVLIYGLAVHEGGLYAGTCEAGPGQRGHVYRYGGDAGWVDCGSPDDVNAVSALASFNGSLYAGVSHYRLRGSSLPESENANPGGRIYRYGGDRSWELVGRLPDVEAINGLVVYRGRLYASSTYSPGLYRYDGGTTWTACGSPRGKRVESLGVFNGHLYATGYDEGAVYRYDGQQWSDCGVLPGATQTYGFAIHGGELYVSTWPEGRVFRYRADNDWVDCGRLGEELEVMGMAIYNGKLYGGTLPLAEVYRYDGGAEWNRVGRVDFTPEVRYRRAWTMAVYDGRLWVGTLPSGHVHSIEAGKNATYDHTLNPGWHHIAAVRDGDRLRLYLDGREVARSTTFEAGDYDLSTDEPLEIGRGGHDYFRGSLSDLRLYRRALTAEEVVRLYEGP